MFDLGRGWGGGREEQRIECKTNMMRMGEVQAFFTVRDGEEMRMRGCVLLSKAREGRMAKAKAEALLRDTRKTIIF